MPESSISQVSTIRGRLRARGLVATEASVDWQRDLHGKPQGVEPNRPLETTLAQHRYDARGRLVETWSSSPSIGGSVRTLHRQYYADTAGAGSQGKLKAESAFYRPGAVFVHDGITVDLNGAMSS